MRTLVTLLLVAGFAALLYGWLGGGQPFRLIGVTLILVGSIPTLKAIVQRYGHSG